MQHHFDISIAQKYGINVAIFLDNLSFWIKKNQANNKHFYNGRYWTYNTSEALTSLFPYWSTDQIDRLIKKCVSSGLMLVDKFNKKKYDQKRWFGLSDTGLQLFNLAIPRNRGTLTAESRDVSRGIAEPIADIKPDTKTDKREPAHKKRALLSVNFIPDKTNLELAKRLNVNAETELESFHNRHKGKKTQYEFARWLKMANEHSNINKQTKIKSNNNEARCTIKFFKSDEPKSQSVYGTQDENKVDPEYVRARGIEECKKIKASLRH